MIADRLRAITKESQSGIYDDFERTSIGTNWDTSLLDSAEIVNGKLVTEGIALDSLYYPEYGAKWTQSFEITGDFHCEGNLEYVERSSDTGRILINLFDSSSTTIFYAGMHDAQAWQSPGFHCAIEGVSSWFSGYGTRPASGTMNIKITRTNGTVNIYENDSLRLTGTLTTSVHYLVLQNTRLSGCNGKTGKWEDITLSW